MLEGISIWRCAEFPPYPRSYGQTVEEHKLHNCSQVLLPTRAWTPPETGVAARFMIRLSLRMEGG